MKEKKISHFVFPRFFYLFFPQDGPPKKTSGKQKFVFPMKKTSGKQNVNFVSFMSPRGHRSFLFGPKKGGIFSCESPLKFYFELIIGQVVLRS